MQMKPMHVPSGVQAPRKAGKRHPVRLQRFFDAEPFRQAPQNVLGNPRFLMWIAHFGNADVHVRSPSKK